MRIKPFAEQGFFTQTHNLLYDVIMPIASGSEWKVLSFVLRRTKGKKRKNASLAYAEIKAGTGIKSDTTIANALEELTRAENSKFGSAVLLSQTAEERQVSRREATRYALNPSFGLDVIWIPNGDGDGTFVLQKEIQAAALALQKMECETAPSRSPKNGERKKIGTPENGERTKTRTPKNGVPITPKNGVRNVAPNIKIARGLTEEINEEVIQEVLSEEEEEEYAREDNLREGDIANSDEEISSSSSSSTSPNPNSQNSTQPVSDSPILTPPIFSALCDVCEFSPDSVTEKNLERMPPLIKWLRDSEGGKTEGGSGDDSTGGADDEIAAKIRAYFAHWDFPNPPALVQIRSEWRRMKSLYEKRTTPKTGIGNELGNGLENALEVRNEANQSDRSGSQPAFETSAERRAKRQNNYYNGLNERRADLERRKREAGLE